MSINLEEVLGQPALYQILNKKKGRSEEETKSLAIKIESSCRKFNNNKGWLSIDEYYNVIKLQNGVDVSKDEIRRLVADLDMNKDFKISIKVNISLSVFLKKNYVILSKKKGFHDGAHYFRGRFSSHGQE